MRTHDPLMTTNTIQIILFFFFKSLLGKDLHLSDWSQTCNLK